LISSDETVISSLEQEARINRKNSENSLLNAKFIFLFMSYSCTLNKKIIIFISPL